MFQFSILQTTFLTVLLQPAEKIDKTKHPWRQIAAVWTQLGLKINTFRRSNFCQGK